MKTKLLTMGLASAMAVAGFASPAIADGEEEEGAWGPFSATITVTSDYRFRGISQTDTGAALQGSFDYAQDWFSAGVWASNVDFSDFGDPDTSIEVDLYAGVSGNLSESTAAGLKVVYYYYPDEDIPGVDYNYWELIGDLTFDLGKASLGAELAWSPDYFGEVGDAVALTGALGVPLCDSLWFLESIEASGHLGQQWFEDKALLDYLYWDLGVSASVGIFTFDARWVDTNLNKGECGGTDNCDSDVVLSLSIALPG